MLGIPYLKIQKLQNVHFMCFDRYEIHIQYFEDVLRGDASFSGARLRKNTFLKPTKRLYFTTPKTNLGNFTVCNFKTQIKSFTFYKFQTFEFPFFKFSKFQNTIGHDSSQVRYTDLPNFQNSRFSDMINHIFKDVPIIFLYSLKYFGDKYGVRGSILS